LALTNVTGAGWEGGLVELLLVAASPVLEAAMALVSLVAVAVDVPAGVGVDLLVCLAMFMTLAEVLGLVEDLLIWETGLLLSLRAPAVNADAATMEISTAPKYSLCDFTHLLLKGNCNIVLSRCIVYI
jgi:hypothetical protein